MTQRRARYAAIHIEEDLPVFNSDTQDHFFSSKRAVKAAIEEDLNEPQEEDLVTGEIGTRRTEGESIKSYALFKEVEW